MSSDTRSLDELVSAVERVGPSDHLCMSYHTQQEELAAAVPFIRCGLDRREQCVYIAAEDSRPAVLDAMHSGGITVGTPADTSALSIVGAAETYQRGGSFEPDRMLGWIRERTAAARQMGFSAFRLVGEMTCVVGPAGLEVERLAEYEAKLNDLLHEQPTSALCVYERRRFAGDVIREVIATHPLVIVGTTVCQNPLFVAPSEYLSPEWPEREVDWLLSNLCTRQRIESDLRATEERYRMLARRLLEVQETERRRIARDLHDDLGQILTGLKIILQTAQSHPRQRAQKLGESVVLVDEAIEHVREATLNLRPPVLDDLGLGAALRWYVSRQAAKAGLEFHLDVPSLDNVRLPPSVESTCFRLVQEAVTNVIRHARARRLDVEVTLAGDEVEVVTRDDGTGFDVDAARKRAAAGGSVGLLSMEERVSLAGGRLTMQSTPGHGTTIRARIPVPRDDAR
jgi:signal transduction histidine kinase